MVATPLLAMIEATCVPWPYGSPMLVLLAASGRHPAEQLRRRRPLARHDHIVLREHAVAALAGRTLQRSLLAPQARVDHGHSHAGAGDAADLQLAGRDLARVVGLREAPVHRARGNFCILKYLQERHARLAQRRQLLLIQGRTDRADDGQISRHRAAGAHDGSRGLRGARRLHDVIASDRRSSKARRLRGSGRRRGCAGRRRRAHWQRLGRPARRGAAAQREQQRQQHA